MATGAVEAGVAGLIHVADLDGDLGGSEGGGWLERHKSPRISRVYLSGDGVRRGGSVCAG